jgi:hypothetical protein
MLRNYDDIFSSLYRWVEQYFFLTNGTSAFDCRKSKPGTYTGQVKAVAAGEFELAVCKGASSGAQIAKIDGRSGRFQIRRIIYERFIIFEFCFWL